MRYFKYFLGLFFISLGVALSIKSDLSVAVFDAFCLNISGLLQIPYWIILTIFYVIFTSLYFWEYRNKDIFLSIIIILVFGPLIELNGKYLLTFTIQSDIMAYGVLFAGINFIGIGVAMMIISKLSLTPYDLFIVQFAKKLKLNYGKARIIIDITLFILAIIIGQFTENHTGIITVLLMIINGPLINLYIRLLKGEKDEIKQVD